MCSKYSDIADTAIELLLLPSLLEVSVSLLYKEGVTLKLN